MEEEPRAGGSLTHPRFWGEGALAGVALGTELGSLGASQSLCMFTKDRSAAHRCARQAGPTAEEGDQHGSWAHWSGRWRRVLYLLCEHLLWALGLPAHFSLGVLDSIRPGRQFLFWKLRMGGSGQRGRAPDPHMLPN